MSENSPQDTRIVQLMSALVLGIVIPFMYAHTAATLCRWYALEAPHEVSSWFGIACVIMLFKTELGRPVKIPEEINHVNILLRAVLSCVLILVVARGVGFCMGWFK